MVVLLFIVYRAVLAPLITLLPAALAVAALRPAHRGDGQAGSPFPSISQLLLIVLLLGAGADYGLFLCFRVREEIRRGREPREALVTAVERVGEAITYSGLTVVAALLTLLLAPFGLYRGLGPALAIGIGGPAGRLAHPDSGAAGHLRPGGVLARPSPSPGPSRPCKVGLWGRVAERVVRHPVGCSRRAWSCSAPSPPA